jgi:hypothetical protein
LELRNHGNLCFNLTKHAVVQGSRMLSPLFSIISLPGARAHRCMENAFPAFTQLPRIHFANSAARRAPNGNFIQSEGAFGVRRAQILQHVVITCKSFRHNKGVQNISKEPLFTCALKGPRSRKRKKIAPCELQDGGEKKRPQR